MQQYRRSQQHAHYRYTLPVCCHAGKLAAVGSMQGRRQIVLVSVLVSVWQIVKLGTPIYIIAS